MLTKFIFAAHSCSNSFESRHLNSYTCQIYKEYSIHRKFRNSNNREFH